MGPQHNTAKATPLPVDMFGRGIDHHIRAMFDRMREHRRREHVVHHEQRARRVRQIGHGFQVDNVQRRVRHALTEDHLGVRTDRGGPFVKVVAVNERHLNAIAHHDLFEDIEARTEQRARRHHVIARATDRHQRRVDRRHARGRRERVLGPLKRGDAFFEHAHGRVAIAGIDEFILTQGDETRFGLLGGVIDEPLGQKDRFGHFAVLAAAGASVNLVGAFAPLGHCAILYANKKTPTG